MYKFILSLLVSIFLCTTTNANEIAKHIKNTNFGLRSNLSAYVFDKTNNKILYQKNEKELLNPASTLKPLTFGIAYDILGKDYKFETELYQNNKNIYIKLGADVLLTQKDLNELISNLKNISFENVYIDDTIIDKKEYPSTWLEEDKWPNQRPLSPYIIDNNYAQISIVRSSLAKKVNIIQDDEYKFSIINDLQIGEKDKIEISRPYKEKSQIIALSGTISKDQTKTLPVLNPEINFYVKVMKAFKKNEISYLRTIQKAKTPQNAIKIASVGHTIEQVSKLILHNSDNFASEIVFKVAAAKSNIQNSEDGTIDGIEIFKEKYANYLQKDEIIFDASGVSRKNFLSSKTIAQIFSNLIENPDFKKLLLTANQGTMKDRLTFLKNNLRVKTGTMKNHSSLCGVLKTRQENEIIFTTIIQNSKKRTSLMKNFENTFIGLIYKKY